MKIKYHEWKCVGCGIIARFTGKDILSGIPYWFTIRTERCRSSSDRPNIDTTACSLDCLQKASTIIDDWIKNRTGLVPDKKYIEASVCDQCGKITKVDALNTVFGPGPLRNWTSIEDPASRKDFCGEGCRKSYILNPEESVFAELRGVHHWGISTLIEIVNSTNIKETIKLLNENPKNPFSLDV